ncbi:hypothetical protein EV2_008360 [Malus domestica]
MWTIEGSNRHSGPKINGGTELGTYGVILLLGLFGKIRKKERIFQKPAKHEMDGRETTKTSSSKKPNIGTSSIDVYAAQCAECKKWRVIHSEEEFEEIRSKISTQPFYCNKKSGVTCDDVADIEYNATRTWVIDKPDLPKTPEGFKRHLVVRKDYSKLDAYYITPKGKRLRSQNQVAAFLKENPMFEGISASDFDFAAPKVMEDTVPEIFGKKGSDSSRKKIKKKKNEDQSAVITGKEDVE